MAEGPATRRCLGFNTLITNALCRRHNSLLSPLDTVGARLFEAIQKCGTTDTGPGLLFLLSGHDIERWMLRSLAIFGVSGNFAIDGAVIDQNFVDRLRIVDLLEDVKQWKKPVGFYLTRGLGHQFWRRDHIRIVPVVMAGDDKIMGITLDLQGLEFALLAADQDLAGTGLDKALYRPGALEFDMNGNRHRIQLSWEDGLPTRASSSRGRDRSATRSWWRHHVHGDAITPSGTLPSR